MATEPPISTVYVQNLEERVKLETVIESLQTIFSEFGEVIDIVAKRNLKAKGQAFVVFEDPEHAKNAAEEVHGFELFQKPMMVSMARSRSDKTMETKASAEDYEFHKRHRLAEKDKRKAAEHAEDQKHLKRGAANPSDGRPAKTVRSGLKSTSAAAAAVVPDEYLPPNKILFLQNLPDDYDIDALTAIFDRFEGFREVRLVPGRRGIAFVEYEAEPGAINAKESTQGMNLGNKTVKVTYQRQ